MNKEIIKKLFIKNDKLINDKKTTKEDRRTYIKINQKLLELLQGE